VNFLSHFYLTNLIIRQQAAARRQGEGESRPPRSLKVINVSSGGYTRGSMDHLDEITSRRCNAGSTLDRGQTYDIYGAYADTKFALMLFTRELNFRHANDHVVCLAAHPGIIIIACLLH